MMRFVSLKFKRLLLLLLLVLCGLVVVFYSSEVSTLHPLFKIFLPQNGSGPFGGSDGDGVNGVKCNNHSKQSSHGVRSESMIAGNANTTTLSFHATPSKSKYNIFVIYTKENYQLHVKFELFTRSLLKYATIPLHVHIITDDISRQSAEGMLTHQMRRYHRTAANTRYSMYNISECSSRVQDIVKVMKPHFSSTPQSYYSDTLFFLSLGLHRIAEEHVEYAILLDCDIVFRADIRHLFAEFEKFSGEHLFGLAPELTPVYRHILYRYRAAHPHTNLGSPLYPGLNSGVVLFHLNRIRSSIFYQEQLQEDAVQRITSKYFFKGHLGDQDFYTLLGYEYPHLIYRMDCVWNRQLCTWWQDHGYSDVFDAYFHCEGKVKCYHGNCNTRVPE